MTEDEHDRLHVTVKMGDLERFVLETYHIDFYDESRYPGLKEVMARCARALANAGSEMTVGMYPKKTMEKLAQYLEERT